MPNPDPCCASVSVDAVEVDVEVDVVVRGVVGLAMVLVADDSCVDV